MPYTPFITIKPTYIGLLGSKNKSNEHRKQLRLEGFLDEEIMKITAPIGLDIGAKTPDEIAVSIVAEIIKVRYARA